ncbi:hypothetical protein PVAP13_9NG243773 [Panicum virgatum]|uniref:Secreted protein n=1 Tax=Panicum virgatum TaxID=38727 RepID=A0A8T0MIC8_PANVG|nr:hypothetical protein PVAP13_9NG243773 [Panicum virgatum]
MSLLIKLLAVLITLSGARVPWPAAAVLARPPSTLPGPNPAQLIISQPQLVPANRTGRHHHHHRVQSVRRPPPQYPPRRDVPAPPRRPPTP